MSVTTLAVKTGELIDLTAKYSSNYWRTPTYDEIYYIINSRTNASNLITFGRVTLPDATARRGMFLLPDDWVTPQDATLVITTDDSDFRMDMTNFDKLIDAGAVFFPRGYSRVANECTTDYFYWTSTEIDATHAYSYDVSEGVTVYDAKCPGYYVRLCRTETGTQTHTFSASASHSIILTPANLQYHCTEHLWRFAEHPYDRVSKSDNESISDSFNGWIDLFGYGTSGINISPTTITEENSDYASGNLNGTDNDWGAASICVDSNPLDTRLKIYENKIRAVEFINI